MSHETIVVFPTKRSSTKESRDVQALKPPEDVPRAPGSLPSARVDAVVRLPPSPLREAQLAADEPPFLDG